MRSLSVFLLLIFTSFSLFGQDLPFNPKQLKPITKKELKKHIEVLASDSLEGRYTGSIGQKKAALYIAGEFEKAGLKPYNDSTYYQAFTLWTWQWKECTLSFKDTKLSSKSDLIYRSSSPIDSLLKAECIFIGDGKDTIINQIDLQGKIAFGFSNNLRNYYRLYYKLKNKGAIGLILANPYDEDAFDVVYKQSVNQNSNRRLFQKKPHFSGTTSKVFIVKAAIAENLFNLPLSALLAKETPEQIKTIPLAKLEVHCPILVKEVVTENVVGFYPGQSQSKETIVMSAHYDHIGKRGEKINYGADDNASGVSALIAIAKTYNKAMVKPDKNILFLATSGEELGLLGALHFAKKQKKLPYDIKANINVDMIGRRDSAHKSNYIYLIGAAEYPVMDSLCHIANQLDSITIDYAYNKSKGFGNFLNLSDHYAFHKQGIPVLGFFSGLHNDYHKPTDTIDKIEFNEMLKRVRLIYSTSFLAAQEHTFK
jgi:Zn-dependent M28 family amino/carboxypeptidase